MATGFTLEDCKLFERYPARVPWGDVTEKDKAAFKDIRERLKEIANAAATSVQSNVQLKAFTSLYEANGRSVTDIWCCVHPAVVENKSYAFQVAVIISARGAEMCFCVGAGTAQIGDAERRREFEGKLSTAKERLRHIPTHIVEAVQNSLDKEWFYHRSWRSERGQQEFTSLAEWLRYASTADGNAASVSTYFTPQEVDKMGDVVAEKFREAVNLFKPLFEFMYGAADSKHFWIFQGNPEYFDLDKYLVGRSEIRWSVNQYPDQLQPGDEVLLWKAGSKGGVIAQCVAETVADTNISEDAPELWKKPPEKTATTRRCRLGIVNKFTEHPISRETIKAALPNLPIFKFAQNTNYPISESDYRKILQMKGDDTSRVNFSAFTEVEDVISGCGLRTPPNFLRRLIASLAAKPFVILTGTSGTGKTKIAQAIALWLTSDRRAYQLIPVGADWTGNDNIVGYPDGLDSTVYVGKPALELIWHAAKNPDLPHFLILDEMNLSHVERYFADLLSATESRDEIPLYSGSARTLSGKELPRSLAVPPNVFVVGTVNVDETTYMFSPKVLDRANVLEFRIDANDIRNYFGGSNTPNLSQIIAQGTALGATLVRATMQQVDTPSDARDRFESEMLLFFNALKPHGVEFGYRVVHEAARFLYFYHELSANDTSWFDKAFDAVIVQKFLPKLHGQRGRLAPLLRKLWFLCVNNETTRGADLLQRLDDVARSTERSAEPSIAPTDSPYPISAEKIARMWRLLNENGFASFAEA